MKVIAVVTLFAAVAVAVPIDLLEQQQNGQQIVLLTAASNSQTDGALHRSKRAIGNQLVVPVVRFPRVNTPYALTKSAQYIELSGPAPIGQNQATPLTKITLKAPNPPYYDPNPPYPHVAAPVFAEINIPQNVPYITLRQA